MLSVIPSAEDVPLRGLRHRIYRWGAGGGPTLILLHGFLDNGRAFDFLAAQLLAHRPDLTLVGLDWRGHGASAWAPPGSYYHFMDYLRDLDALVEHLGGGPVSLVGHSMGGNVSLYYAGSRPERVTRVAFMESIFVPDTPADLAPERTRAWLDALAVDPPRPRRITPTLAGIAQRLRYGITHADDDVLLYLAKNAAEAVPGGFVMRFDPLHRTQGPYPFYLEPAKAFWRSTRCPVLALEGSESPFTGGDLADRYACFGDLTRDTIPNAGHGMHVENPAAVAASVLVWAGLL